jgi:hypothetical protein
MLCRVKTKLDTAGPAEKRRLRKSAELIRYLLAPRPVDPPPSLAPPEPDWRTRPNPAPISGGGQRRLRARWDGGSHCKSLSVACGHSRSRRNSSMRARMVAKSSAARGRVTFPLHWLVSSLLAGGSLAAHRESDFNRVNVQRQRGRRASSRLVAPVQVVSTVPAHTSLRGTRWRLEYASSASHSPAW